MTRPNVASATRAGSARDEESELGEEGEEEESEIGEAGEESELGDEGDGEEEFDDVGRHRHATSAPRRPLLITARPPVGRTTSWRTTRSDGKHDTPDLSTRAERGVACVPGQRRRHAASDRASSAVRPHPSVSLLVSSVVLFSWGLCEAPSEAFYSRCA